MLANRRAGAAMVVHHAARLGDLTPGLDADQAIDVLWLYNDPALYGALVLTRGWTAAAFQRWLAASMRAALLAG